MRRKKKRRMSDAVELNLAAMLDMAFQLLTFFILTFKPAPIEGQVTLNLPPPEPITNVDATQQAGADESNTDPVAGLDTLVISIFSAGSGRIESLALGEGNVTVDPNLNALNNRLKAAFADPDSPFDQVILQVSSSLLYDELMRVIDVCTRQKLPTGKKLSKLSFVELPGAETPAPN